MEENKINPINIRHVVNGFLFLCIGIAIYLFDRHPNQIFFIHALKLPSFYNPGHEKLFAVLNYNLPSFLHVCSFSLLTCALLPKQSKISFIMVCLGWVSTNIFCEIGQLIAPYKLENIHYLTFNNRYLVQFFNYFQYGTFDFLDIVFASIGGVFAYCILISTYDGGENEIRSINIE